MKDIKDIDKAIDVPEKYCKKVNKQEKIMTIQEQIKQCEDIIQKIQTKCEGCLFSSIHSVPLPSYYCLKFAKAKLKELNKAKDDKIRTLEERLNDKIRAIVTGKRYTMNT